MRAAAGYDGTEEHIGIETIRPEYREASMLSQALMDVLDEVKRASAKHPRPEHYASAHEGKSVIEEELDELWEHVKADTGYSDEAYTEAKQVAATAVRYMLMVRCRQQRRG